MPRWRRLNITSFISNAAESNTVWISTEESLMVFWKRKKSGVKIESEKKSESIQFYQVHESKSI